MRLRFCSNRQIYKVDRLLIDAGDKCGARATLQLAIEHDHRKVRARILAKVYGGARLVSAHPRNFPAWMVPASMWSPADRANEGQVEGSAQLTQDRYVQ